MSSKILILAGATATGKSDLALEIAQKAKCDIVNFDSLLFYNELNIGTAKPSPEQLASVKHHMVNISTIKNHINAADFFKKAVPIINKCHQEKKDIILVGGSGFYLQTILNGMYDSPSTSKEIRLKSDQLYQEEGITPFLEFLKQNDPESYSLYHQNDHYRIRRAVEHFWMHSTKFSNIRDQKAKNFETPPKKYGWDIMFCYLDIDKTEHFEIIKSRTQKMIHDGLEKECKDLLNSGFKGTEKPLQSIGYKEIQEYIKGNITPLEDCIERINISTRQLAKAQRTWFKKLEKKDYNILTQRDILIEEALKFLGNK